MLKFLQANGTKIIGAAQGVVAALAGVAGLVPEAALPYFMGASAVLTVWRGFDGALTHANLWADHGTKIIGLAQGTVAALAGVAGIIPPAHLKYWLAASALLTAWRGFVNSINQQTQARV